MLTNFLHFPRMIAGNADPWIECTTLNSSVMTTLNLSYLKSMTIFNNSKKFFFDIGNKHLKMYLILCYSLKYKLVEYRNFILLSTFISKDRAHHLVSP